MKIENPEQFRENIVAKIMEKIPEKSAKNLEKGIFNWSLKEAGIRKIVKKWDNPAFVILYTNRLKSIMINLSPEIVEKLISKEIPSHQIAFMTHQELNPQKWDEAIKRKILRDKNKCETNIESATDAFVCRKCKGNKTNYYQMQTRSADEPMTTFVTCLNCDARWKC